jgi:DNA-binding MarR family transcriptional regulator
LGLPRARRFPDAAAGRQPGLPVSSIAPEALAGTALAAWRSFLQSHVTILRELDAEVTAAHGITTRDYEVLLYLAQAPDRQLAMSVIAQRTMLTRSGVTRLVDGLVSSGLIERVGCPADARVLYAQLTDAGHDKLRDAGRSHVASIRRVFLEHYNTRELELLARLLARLPGAQHDSSGTVW